MSKRYKVVIDTNVFIRGWFYNDLNCRLILDMIKKRKLYLAFSQDSIGELLYVTKNFSRRHISNDSDRLTLLNGISKLFYYGSSANTVGMVDVDKVIDKTDLMFVHCAIKYGADYIISNDFKSGMFNLDSKYSFNVVDTNEFIRLINE
ncbi:putative toxin-antitoxin system toxin component, PIN family [Rossellomorea sp. BNER]|uniref:putative toxin-antitoxin system toxin component, PIN family n=1 Tax=Rossellomorea sp. BNER TaxID=2962031 RepID=UPI003AF29BCC|nr:putative toxin-antitoxin system toxin component, PIN family [Rossellomorea sp. BNER]